MRKLLFDKMLLSLVFIGLLVGCSGENEHQAQGYVEGKFTYLSTPLSGQLKQLSVERGASVQSGALIFTLDAESEQAQLTQLKSALWLAEQTLIRNHDLYRKKAVPKAVVDHAKSQYDQTKAQVKQAQWAVDQKLFTAPKSAQVFDTYYLSGEFVPAGRPIVSLLAPEDIKIIFYISEPILSTLKLGNTVTIKCDGCPIDKPLSATIQFISPQNEYTPPVIFSTETRQKLVYRVEAAPAPYNATLFKPGQPITVLFR
ncbi:MAG: HlyD family secretion protein [Gammaproteobacteria bacterium]